MVDVGVAHGTDWLYDAYPAAQYFLVEPVVEFRPAMEELARRLKAEIILAAAGPERGETVIKLYGATLSSSTIIKTYGKRRVAADAADDRRIPVIPLDSLLARESARGPFLLKMDIQGAELLALQGATRMLEDTELIILETSLFNFQGSPDFAEVVANLRARGFCVYDILGGAYRRFDGALGQVDLVFVKEDGFFRKHKKWD